MEFNENLLYNFASIIATVLFFGVAAITVFRRLKFRWPIKANCWFCNKNTRIYRNKVDWWQCPNCEQYNGFTKDGDYAYDIPEQSTESPRIFAKKFDNLKPDDKKSLCDDCNRKEELKVAELRKFETEWFFNTRLESFKNQLELKYPLCENCRDFVENVLHKQSQWLTQYKMLFFKQKSVSEVIHNAKKVDKAVRIFLTILTSAMMYYPNFWPLPFVGAFFQTSAFIINETRKRKWDAILTLLWIFISLIGPLNELNFVDYRITKEWPSLKTISEYQFVTALAVIIGFTNVTSRYRNSRSIKAAFKKLESPVGAKKSLSIKKESFKDFDSSGEKFETKNYSNYRQSPTEIDTPLPIKNPLFTQNLRKPGNEANTSPHPFLITTKKKSPEISEIGSRHILKFDENSEQYSLNESLSTLKTLSLGETRPLRSPKMPRLFKTKIYGTTSPDLFQRSFKPSTRKFILAPAKLKSVAQTSWVAGGYWQVGVEPPSLSRSSSQSSGFGSAGSNFGPSREPSLSKDIDKCSVVSDAQYCFPSRPNSVNSLTSCCKHISPLQYSSHCDSPIYGQPLRIIPNSLFLKNSQTHFSPLNRPEATNGCFEHCHTLQNRNFDASILQQNQQLTNCSNGYHAVLTNPVWLPVLLCGSLVFNIAVFCTILLR